MLAGLVALVTGSVSISLVVYTELSKRHARIFGAGMVVFGLVVVTIRLLVRTGRFEGGEIAMGGFFVFFVAVSVLATIMSGVQLVGWARSGEETDEVRKRALVVAFVLVVQSGFLILVGIMLATYYGHA